MARSGAGSGIAQLLDASVLKSWGNGEKHEALKVSAMQGLGAPRDGAAVQRWLLKAP